MKYTGENLKEILFPLGGIGTGSISIAGNGILRDFEIFNRPNKGSLNGFTHFAVRVATPDGKVYTRAVCGDVTKDLTGQYSNGRFCGYGFGVSSNTMNGFPHFRNCELDAHFPFAELTFSDPDFPGKLLLAAWNPLIPRDADNSGLPAAFFELTYVNDSDGDANALLCFSAGCPFESAVNTAAVSASDAHVHMRSTLCENDLSYGDFTLACEHGDIAEESWYRGDWCDAVVTYWNELTAGTLSQRHYNSPGKDHATVGKHLTVPAHTSKSVRFLLTWNVPNCCNSWSPVKDENGNHKMWKNHYATRFADSLATSDYALTNYADLYRRTRAYCDAMFSQTLPEYVIDAAANTLSVLKTPTALRLENGAFYGWEGLHEHEGSCEGTCQHVWNYAYAMCFLFPALERSIRDLEFTYQTDNRGSMDFRLKLPLGRVAPGAFPCLDGQMGAVIKTYREWKISGDDAWLKSHWESVKNVLEFAWSSENPFKWDENKNGIADGRMHHTLDMELFGASGWLEGFYLAALKAAAEMAGYLGESDKEKEYLALFEKGYAWTKDNLFNGSYFIQNIDLTDKSIPERFGCADRYWNEETGEIKYQIGEGCDIDQLCGQWHANILGLGRLFDCEQTHTALKNLYKNNFKPTLRGFVNPWRVFSLNDEAGAVMCDYPSGSYKPKIPVPYCEETMHGFEYQLAGMLISEGFIDQGLTIVKSVRDRYNGSNRNPWNEIECGSNYARSMASFALIPLLAGFVFDMPRGILGFDPKINREHFKCIWSLDCGWGSYEKTPDGTRIEVTEGALYINTLALPYLSAVKEVLADGRSIDFTFDNGQIHFSPLAVRQSIEIR